MKKLFSIITVILCFSVFAQAKVRPYSRVVNSAKVDKLVKEVTAYLDKNSMVPASFSAQTYSIYLNEGDSLESALKQMMENECWGDCYSLKLPKLLSLEQLKSMGDVQETDEVFGPGLIERIVKATTPYDKNHQRMFTTASYHDGGSYWSPSIYIVTIDPTEKDLFELVKIEYLEGK